jgi:hypothetical protein
MELSGVIEEEWRVFTSIRRSIDGCRRNKAIQKQRETEQTHDFIFYFLAGGRKNKKGIWSIANNTNNNNNQFPGLSRITLPGEDNTQTKILGAVHCPAPARPTAPLPLF